MSVPARLPMRHQLHFQHQIKSGVKGRRVIPVHYGWKCLFYETIKKKLAFIAKKIGWYQ
jgi:hypothetical protein